MHHIHAWVIAVYSAYGAAALMWFVAGLRWKKGGVAFLAGVHAVLAFGLVVYWLGQAAGLR